MTPTVPLVSIPDKLYAAARASGYEEGMRDASRMTVRWMAANNILGETLSSAMLNPEARARVLGMLVEED